MLFLKNEGGAPGRELMVEILQVLHGTAIAVYEIDLGQEIETALGIGDIVQKYLFDHESLIPSAKFLTDI